MATVAPLQPFWFVALLTIDSVPPVQVPTPVPVGICALTVTGKPPSW